MKVYRIKHKPSGMYISDAGYEIKTKIGKVFTKATPYLSKYIDNPDYEILYDEIKD